MLFRSAAKMAADKNISVNALRRGYAIVQRADGALVRDASALTVGEKLTVRAGVGSADASVTGVHASNVDA